MVEPIWFNWFHAFKIKIKLIFFWIFLVGSFDFFLDLFFFN
jgi:hypothetical protein